MNRIKTVITVLLLTLGFLISCDKTDDETVYSTQVEFTTPIK